MKRSFDNSSMIEQETAAAAGRQLPQENLLNADISMDLDPKPNEYQVALKKGI